ILTAAPSNETGLSEETLGSCHLPPRCSKANLLVGALLRDMTHGRNSHYQASIRHMTVLTLGGTTSDQKTNGSRRRVRFGGSGGGRGPVRVCGGVGRRRRGGIEIVRCAGGPRPRSAIGAA